jgi:transposase
MNKKIEGIDQIFVGIDLHNNSWHVTARSFDQELRCASMPPSWEALKKVLQPFAGIKVIVAYEAGYFGFWLYRKLQEWGAECRVVAPSLIPKESGNRVKTDRKDSRKIAFLLSRNLLKGIHVPSKLELSNRQIIRFRKQIVQEKVRVQLRIKALLRLYGIEFICPPGRWSGKFIQHLRKKSCGETGLDFYFHTLLDQFELLTEKIKVVEQRLKELAKNAYYQKNVALLKSIPGVGELTAIELLLELQDVKRFSSGDKLAAYVGLTPSQYSSGDKVRMGKITRIGKPHLRGILVEASWILIRKDPVMKKKYGDIKLRRGGKRAIVAIARKMLIIARRILLDQVSYNYKGIEEQKAA